MPAPCGARGLGVDGFNVVAGIDKRIEDRRGKGRGAHKDEVERLSRRHGALRSNGYRKGLRGDGNSAALGFGELAEDHSALDHGEMIYEQDAVEVFDLVLQASREQSLGLHLADFVLIVNKAQPDLCRPGNVGLVLGQRQTALAEGR